MFSAHRAYDRQQVCVQGGIDSLGQRATSVPNTNRYRTAALRYNSMAQVDGLTLPCLSQRRDYTINNINTVPCTIQGIALNNL